MRKFFVVIILSGFVLSSLSSNVFSQKQKKQKRMVVEAQVIGQEIFDFGWPMEFESVEIFYVRVDKVLKGKTSSKYIRIAYGHNPSSAPQYNLPKEMFDGKTRWRFELSEWSMFDAKISVSKVKGDWLDTEHSKKANEQITETPIIPKCGPVAGFEAEAAKLEQFETVKANWLDFQRKAFKKL